VVKPFLHTSLEVRGSKDFLSTRVTSDLDPKLKKADHRQGGGGIRRRRLAWANSFALKILTSNSLGLKILQTLFAEPAPVKAFERLGGGGYPSTEENSQNGTLLFKRFPVLKSIFSWQISTRLNLS
jgi:hypothetical protein